MMASDLHSTA